MFCNSQKTEKWGKCSLVFLGEDFVKSTTASSESLPQMLTVASLPIRDRSFRFHFLCTLLHATLCVGTYLLTLPFHVFSKPVYQIFIRSERSIPEYARAN